LAVDVRQLGHPLPAFDLQPAAPAVFPHQPEDQRSLPQYDRSKQFASRRFRTSPVQEQDFAAGGSRDSLAADVLI
jgi:hypothetical protein